MTSPISIAERDFAFDHKAGIEPRESGRPRGWRAVVLRMGHPAAMAAITLMSVCASVTVTTLVLWGTGGPSDGWVPSLLTAVLVPMIVAPLVSHSMMSLLYDVERTRAQLHEAAIRDGLTSAYNRRFFMARLEVEAERARREGQPLSAVMIDVDHFKAINDTHGHAAGDRVLEQLAHTLISTVRPFDLVARYGGEEFVALMPGATLVEAIGVAERVRVAVEAMSVEARSSQPLIITASLGVSSFGVEDVRASAMLERADQAMYRAKRSGRNRCVCLPPGNDEA